MRTANESKSQSGWVISLADLMGLLVSFFVMITVMLTQDSDKFSDIASSMRKAFKSDGKNEVIVLIPPKIQENDQKLELNIKQFLSKEPSLNGKIEQIVIQREENKITIILKR